MSRIAIDARKIADFGVGTYIRNLLTGLARLAPDDEFLVFLPPRGRLPVESPRFTVLHSEARNYGLSEHVSLPLRAAWKGADLYHAPHYVLPWLTHGPAVVTIHDIIHLRFPEYLPSRAAFRYAETVMRHSYRRAARVLTVSQASKSDLLAWFGGDPDRIEVVPSAVDEAFFEPRSSEHLARVRERWRLPERYVLYSGNVKPHKNLERLIRAFARVREDTALDDVKLVLIGSDVARYHGLRRLAAELRIAEHVRFLAWMPKEELAAIYALATVFAYPSLYEGFGLPPLEAMACGVPVVVSDASSLPEVCGDAALFVDPSDVEKIARALATVLGDERICKDLARRGLERAERFRHHDQAGRVLAVYHQVLGR
jgi:glycosyltransferase involved in cell wall biosynthesis